MGRSLVADAGAFPRDMRLPFGGCEFRALGGYDELLRWVYGDYMKLPPETERVGHHFYSIFRRDSMRLSKYSGVLCFTSPIILTIWGHINETRYYIRNV